MNFKFTIEHTFIKDVFLKSIMRIFVFLCCAITFAFGPSEGFSQNADITISANETLTVKQVFRLINKQAKYKFIYRHDLIKKAPKVYLEKGVIKAKTLLDKCLLPINFTYKFTENETVIVKKKSVEVLEKKTDDFQIKITGAILDVSGQPLPGANIIEKGTANGTQSDFDGKFSLDLSSGNATIIVSFIGFTTQEVDVNNQTNLTITLLEDTESLDEIILVGYGAVKKEDQTTSVVSVKAEDFNQGVISSPEQLIQGKAAGVNITQSNGEPGSSIRIRVRGGKSITASNEPLYIVDGVPITNAATVPGGGGIGGNGGLNTDPGNPLAFLNPNDIASINILKDAAAAAIYGSRGANGVVIITTKKGKSGEAKLSYTVSASVGYIRNRFDIYSADELRDLDLEGQGLSPLVDSGANTDWQDELFRTSFSQQHNIAYSGGGNGNSYRASISYSDSEGVLFNSGLERLTGRFNFNQSVLDDRLNISSNLTASKINRGYAPNEQTGNFFGGILNGLFNFSPTQTVRDANGEFSTNGNFANPVKTYEDITDRSVDSRILGNLEAKLKLVKSLTLTGNVGVDYGVGERRTHVARGFGAAPNGFASRSTRTNSSKLLETYLTYDTTFGSEGQNSLQVVGGYSFQQFDSEGFSARANDLTFDNLGFNSFSSNSDPLAPGVGRSSSRLISYFGRAQYNHDSRYIISAVLRADGSSRFGANNKYAYFPAVSAAWRIINEGFMKNQSVFSDLKLKGSFGSIGNQAIQPYQSLPGLGSVGQYDFGGFVSQALFFTTFPEPDLKWETTETFNIGLDWGLLGGKLSGGIEYYNSETRDLLLRVAAPPPSDPSSFITNIGSVKNSGIEGTLNYEVVNNEDFSWDLGFVFATLKNEVLAISNDSFGSDNLSFGNISGEGAPPVAIYRIEAGQPLNSFYGLVYDGIVNGQESYVDLNGDGTVDSDDRTFIGDAQPDFTYSVSSNLSYKNWDLSLFFRGISGIEVFNNTAWAFSGPTRLPNRNAIRGAFEEGETNPARGFSSRFVENASFFRLDNFTLGYTLPDNVLKFTDQVRISLSGQNVFVITNYSGEDPEVVTGGAPGLDYLTYPRPITFTLGLNVNF